MINFKYVRETLEREFKGKAANESGSGCKYYNYEGKKCVIGCFLDQGDLEQLSLDNPFIKEALNMEQYNFSQLPTQNEVVLSKWQRFHDEKLHIDTPLQNQKDALFNEFVSLCREEGLRGG